MAQNCGCINRTKIALKHKMGISNYRQQARTSHLYSRLLTNIRERAVNDSLRGLVLEGQVFCNNGRKQDETNQHRLQVNSNQFRVSLEQFTSRNECSLASFLFPDTSCMFCFLCNNFCIFYDVILKKIMLIRERGK